MIQRVLDIGTGTGARKYGRQQNWQCPRWLSVVVIEIADALPSAQELYLRPDA